MGSLIKVRDKIFYLQRAVGRMVSRDRLVVRTLCCGRSNPGSNPRPGMTFLNSFYFCFSKLRCRKIVNLEIFPSYN